MKPPSFDYVVPISLEAAVEALVAANGDGKAMAGGQSLMPLLNFRITRPLVVVDLLHIPGLSFNELRDDIVAIGALTQHADLEFSDLIAAKLPVMAAAMPHVALVGAPLNFITIPARISMWGNDVHGDCVTAEEAFAKACNAPEIFLPDGDAIAWATRHGVLEGA